MSVASKTVDGLNLLVDYAANHGARVVSFEHFRPTSLPECVSVHALLDDVDENITDHAFFEIRDCLFAHGWDLSRQCVHGDFKGTSSLDGFNGLTVFDLIKNSDRPKDYWPIGIRIYGFGESGTTGSPSIPSLMAKVLCVDIQQTGLGPDQIAEYCRSHPELHTFEFDAEIDVSHFVSQLKRLDIVLLSRLVEDAEVRIQPIDD